VNETTGIVKLRGLPYATTEDDVRTFFAGLKVRKDGVKRAIQAGKPSGDAFVLFESKDEALRALKLNSEKIGTRYIEVIASTPKEFDSFMNHNFIDCPPTYSRDKMPNVAIDKRK
jgi:RNA recognition motif-containing protein